MEYRIATAADTAAIMPVIEDAKRHLASMGVDQWQDGFPDENTIRADIATGNAYVFCENGEIGGFLLYGDRPEAAYDSIYDGAWLTSGTEYGVIHRTAAAEKYRGRGLSGQMFALCERLSRERGFKSIRVDTHADNLVMRHIAEKNGYSYCGKIYLYPGNVCPRVGYEKVLE